MSGKYEKLADDIKEEPHRARKCIQFVYWMIFITMTTFSTLPGIILTIVFSTEKNYDKNMMILGYVLIIVSIIVEIIAVLLIYHRIQ